MVQTSIILFSLGITVLLFVGGYLYRESKKQRSGFLILAGFMVLLLTGLVMIVDPLTFRSGENVYTQYTYIPNATGENGDIQTTNSTITYEYSEQANSLNGALAFIILLAGLFGSMESVKRLYVERTDKNSNFSEDEY